MDRGGRGAVAGTGGEVEGECSPAWTVLWAGHSLHEWLEELHQELHTRAIKR